MSPRGRRPAGEDTRGQIVDAARAEFGAQGYDATSMRAVARRAGVDPALVHHYFDGKAALFAAVMDVPVDPQQLIGRVLSGPPEAVGEGLVRLFLHVWDGEESRHRFIALVRSAVSNEQAAAMLRGFVVREVFGRVVAELEPELPAAEQDLRAGLAAAQMIGLAMARYVIAMPGVVDASHDELADRLGPVLQGYLSR